MIANGNQFENTARYEQVYARPSSSNPPPLPKSSPPVYQTVGNAVQPYEVPSISMVTVSQNTAQEYEVPSITSTGVNRVNGQKPSVDAPSYRTLEPSMVCFF